MLFKMVDMLEEFVWSNCAPIFLKRRDERLHFTTSDSWSASKIFLPMRLLRYDRDFPIAMWGGSLLIQPVCTFIVGEKQVYVESSSSSNQTSLTSKICALTLWSVHNWEWNSLQNPPKVRRIIGVSLHLFPLQPPITPPSRKLGLERGVSPTQTLLTYRTPTV